MNARPDLPVKLIADFQHQTTDDTARWFGNVYGPGARFETKHRWLEHVVLSIVAEAGVIARATRNGTGSFRDDPTRDTLLEAASDVCIYSALLADGMVFHLHDACGFGPDATLGDLTFIASAPAAAIDSLMVGAAAGQLAQAFSFGNEPGVFDAVGTCMHSVARLVTVLGADLTRLCGDRRARNESRFHRAA